jgi:uncharacterized Ntn-hydrolase superfamily protein
MTFTVAGLCRRTGQFGAALATSSIGAGGRCAHVAPGHGLVVTQARTDPRLGPVGLDRLRAGRSAAETVTDIAASTPHRSWRQLGVLTAEGDAAVWTGPDVAQPADGMVLSDGFEIGNWVKTEAVIAAIAAGFETDPAGDLADRLIQGLEEGAAAGGELDPLQSAAVIVCAPAYAFPIVDLRVDLSETPIDDLRRTWARWAEIMDGYLLRAVDPAAAPDTRSLEGHA